jgi:hypothetical protein
LPRALQSTKGKEEGRGMISGNDYENGSFDNLEIGGGIRIKISKEKKVLNHLNPSHENSSLLF